MSRYPWTGQHCGAWYKIVSEELLFTWSLTPSKIYHCPGGNGPETVSRALAAWPVCHCIPNCIHNGGCPLITCALQSVAGLLLKQPLYWLMTCHSLYCYIMIVYSCQFPHWGEADVAEQRSTSAEGIELCFKLHRANTAFAHSHAREIIVNTSCVSCMYDTDLQQRKL